MPQLFFAGAGTTKHRYASAFADCRGEFRIQVQIKSIFDGQYTIEFSINEDEYKSIAMAIKIISIINQ